MPPPGVLPPAYSNGHIPRSYMNKRPIPAGADSNTRPFIIFFSYLGLCALLTLYVVQKLWKNYIVLSKSRTAKPPPKRYVFLFVGLAASSLLSTWYYMIRYFQASYQTWLLWRSYYDLPDEQKHWGLWLRDTSLFKEAWEIVIVGNARYWWSHQIFFFACVLGLALEQKGVRRGIRHTWVFMLIGQIVAISFATNLFLVALLSSPPAQPAPPSNPFRKRWVGPWLINFAAIIATEIPVYLLAEENYWHSKRFLPVLLIPHLALLVLPFARAITPSRYFRDDDAEFAEGMYKYLWGATIFGGALLWLKVTSLAYNYSGIIGTFNAIQEHPAVSSVGFDVIFCWISWILWCSPRVQNGLKNAQMTGKGAIDSTSEGTTTTVTDGNYRGALRRR